SVAIPEPPLPYIRNAFFDIKPHKPPPPFGGSSYLKPDPDKWKCRPVACTIVEQCLEHLPRETTPPLPDKATRRLKVTQQIRCGDPCNAQVVRCDIDGKDLVAKIFDPLYIESEKCEEYERSPTYFVESFYSCEAAAYMRIREKGLDGEYTPRFEGCWSLKLPLHDAEGRFMAFREVRLILQQFIPGDTMQALIDRGEVAKIDPEVRMDLLDRIMEAQSRLFIGVQSDDLHPRNFMVWKDANKSNRWQITLIDFSHSRVRDLPNSKWQRHRGEDTRLPESRITFSGRCWPPRCRGWIPKEFNGFTFQK
ncbi:hypothetical protein F5883DRAFT_441360, partial [Diaporthe sp. PMI_573]